MIKPVSVLFLFVLLSKTISAGNNLTPSLPPSNKGNKKQMEAFTGLQGGFIYTYNSPLYKISLVREQWSHSFMQYDNYNITTKGWELSFLKNSISNYLGAGYTWGLGRAFKSKAKFRELSSNNHAYLPYFTFQVKSEISKFKDIDAIPELGLQRTVLHTKNYYYATSMRLGIGYGNRIPHLDQDGYLWVCFNLRWTLFM